MNNYFIKKGDKVRIRTLEWFNFFSSDYNYNCIGQFVSGMSKYCGKEATITEIIFDDEDKKFDMNTTGFLLDIDNENWVWQEFMFEPSYLIRNNIGKYCEYCENNNICCDLCLFDKNNLELPLTIGDSVTIKSIKWFEYNGIPMDYDDILYYSGKDTVITEVIKTNNSNIFFYKLKIDYGRNLWGDYMFSLYQYYKTLIKSYCKSYCLKVNRDCNLCLLFDKK